jgi:hypothetical protein
MDPAHIVAERKINAALDAGLFEHLPVHGRIECSLHGEEFLAWWFRMHYGSEGSRPALLDDGELL